MKILFLNLPFKFKVSRASRWPEKTKSGTLYYPYWLAYCAGVCLERGIEANLVDCIAHGYSVDETLRAVREYAPDYIVVELTTPTCAEDFKTVSAIKSDFPSGIIIAGGTHATALPEQSLDRCPAIDIIARHEYDFTVPDIASGIPLAEVRGISYRAGGAVTHTPDRAYTEDLDALPFVSKVYQKFLNANDYFYAFAQKPMIQIFSARGCPYFCDFCSYPGTMGGRRFRKRSVKNFVDELEYICKEMPEIREIFFEDDTFTVDKKRVLEICGEIRRRGLKITWSVNTRADLPYDVMKAMKDAGCRLLVVGYESGSQAVLDAIRKGIKLEQSLEFAKNSKKLKLKVFGCFMIGLTGDSMETIEETYRFAKKIAPEMCFFQQAVPFPGTQFYAWAKDNGYLTTEDYGEWLDGDGYLRCLVNYPYMNTREVERIRDKLMSRYYFSFSYFFKTFLANLSWQEFKRVTKAGCTYLLFRIKKAGR